MHQLASGILKEQRVIPGRQRRKGLLGPPAASLRRHQRDVVWSRGERRARGSAGLQKGAHAGVVCVRKKEQARKGDGAIGPKHANAVAQASL
jgi:hypothetical protein